ncbi:sulfite reductase [NADPH] flavoprotein component [Coemansia biformis]|uniref:Sulfite reductase [NADPH] flavoprotein component n=1 Tax=Coemansia biformis TaxID=1286918 RepID=A0A9W7YG23_9FUNG|nr:sulfite reductase [NADPH] flavoprotein component [Coemansia biformis]
MPAVVADSATAMPAPSLIVGLRLSGKKAAVIGEGQAAASRAMFALDAGAKVVLYAADTPAALSKWLAAGRLSTVPAGRYAPADLAQFSVVLVAGATPGVDPQAVARDAHAAGVPVNVAGDAALSDFTLMPTYRGASSLQIAVTTNGVAPRVASQLLGEIVNKLPESLDAQLRDVALLSHTAREAARQRDSVLASILVSDKAKDTEDDTPAAPSADATATGTPALQTPSPESVDGAQHPTPSLDLARLRDESGAQIIQAVDVQTASSYIAHSLSHLCFVYSAPGQGLGEAALAWSRRAEKNAFGEWVSALRMETRHGAGHALWGALSSGSKVAAIASAASLPYMMPVLAGLVARKQPIVIHAAAQSVDAAQTDFADAFVALQTNAVFLASATAQEAHDVALIAHAVAHAASIPVVHLTSGGGAAAEPASACISGHRELVKFVDAVAAAAAAEGPSVRPADVVELALAHFTRAFGRTYRQLEYSGSTAAETVFVAIGETASHAQAALPVVLKQRDTGVLNVRALRPWDHAQLLASLPATTKRLVVLASSKDTGTAADALVADVALAAILGRPSSPIRVVRDNVYGADQAAVANAIRVALGLEPESASSDAAGSNAAAIAKGEAPAAAAAAVAPAAVEPNAAHADTLEIAKRLAFPEAFSTQLVPRSGEKTFVVKVSALRRMTPTTYDRNIIHIEFDTQGTGLTYEIGDALGVFGHNDATQVNQFCAQYGLDGSQLVAAVKDGQSQIRSVHSWLTHALDLFGRPSKKFYAVLADFATDAKQAERLRWLTTGEGSAEFKARVADTVTYADILLEFASARPSFLHLVELIAPIKPRHYSIASSARMHPGSVHLCVVTVDWTNSRGELRTGQCTRYLDSLAIGDRVTVGVKPSVMKLPPLDSQPVIMAGLGTGMAPFRAFIEERAARKLQGVDVGPMTLYFGSRHRAMEYLYGEEFEAYHADGLLTNLRLAFSRDQKDKVYIQHKMREDSELLAAQLLSQDGSFYLCGPTWPAGDVKDAITGAFTAHGGVKPSDASKFIEELKESERYILEVY